MSNVAEVQLKGACRSRIVAAETSSSLSCCRNARRSLKLLPKRTRVAESLLKRLSLKLLPKRMSSLSCC